MKTKSNKMIKPKKIKPSAGIQPLIHRKYGPIAAQFASMIRHHLEIGNFEQAKRTIDAAERELEQLRLADQKKPLGELINKPIAALDLPVRTTNAFEDQGKLYIRDLLAMRVEEIHAIAGLADGSIRGIFDALEAFGIVKHDEDRAW